MRLNLHVLLKDYEVDLIISFILVLRNNVFKLGKTPEVLRDELKFTKFIGRLRKRFGELFLDILKTQLILKGVLTLNDWRSINQKIHYEWQTDSQFAELKEAEMTQERLNLLQSMNFADEIVGNFYSKDYVRKRILKQTQEEIDQMDKEIAQEAADGGDEPDDEYASFEPKHGEKLAEEDKDLKSMENIFKSVLEEDSKRVKAN